jgi:hypothetical protein
VAVWPLRVAESVTVVPTTGVVFERLVEIARPTATVNGSHALVDPLLLTSPEYTALKLKLPVLLKMTALLLGITPLVTVTMEATVPGAVQRPLLKTLYVTVPLAWKKVARVEESVKV